MFTRSQYFHRDRIESIERGGMLFVMEYGGYMVMFARDVYLRAGFHPIKAVASDSNILSTGIRLDQTFHTLRVGGHTSTYGHVSALHFL